jgi:hypothetical protein
MPLSRYIFLSAAAATFFVLSNSGVRAESKLVNESSFLPTWKLFRTNESKQQFVAGYISGFRDAARVTDAAIEYARDNPNNAVSGLEKVKGIYEMEGLTAESLVAKLDEFFSEPDGKNATLSQAMVAARNRLGH